MASKIGMARMSELARVYRHKMTRMFGVIYNKDLCSGKHDWDGEDVRSDAEFRCLLVKANSGWQARLG